MQVYDPSCEFIRHWCPEIAHWTNEELSNPNPNPNPNPDPASDGDMRIDADDDLQAGAGEAVGGGGGEVSSGSYPSPVCPLLHASFDEAKILKALKKKNKKKHSHGGMPGLDQA